MSEGSTRSSHRDKRLNSKLLFQTMRNMDNLIVCDLLEPNIGSRASGNIILAVRKSGSKYVSTGKNELCIRNKRYSTNSVNVDVQCGNGQKKWKNITGYQPPDQPPFPGLSVYNGDEQNIRERNGNVELASSQASTFSEEEVNERLKVCSITQSVNCKGNEALSIHEPSFFQNVIGFRTNRTCFWKKALLIIFVLFTLAHPFSLLAFALPGKSSIQTASDGVFHDVFSGVNNTTSISFPRHSLSGESLKYISPSIIPGTNYNKRQAILGVNFSKLGFDQSNKYLYEVKPSIISHEPSVGSVYAHPASTFSTSLSLHSTSYSPTDSRHSDASDGHGSAHIGRYGPNSAALVAKSTDISLAKSTPTNEVIQSEEPAHYNEFQGGDRSPISESRTKTQIKRQNINEQKEGDGLDQNKTLKKMVDSKEQESFGDERGVEASPFSKSLSPSQQKRHQSGRQRLGQTPPPPPLRTNIVEENPSLDVGPLVHIRVEAGHTARLPCAHRPQYTNDSARVVLWYRNDTTRPFLSYDGREEQDSEGSKEQNLLFKHYLHHHPGHRVPASIQNFGGKQPKSSGSSDLPWSNDVSSSERISLEEGGKTLVLKYVQSEDQAEYRCIVHYKRSPAATQRMQLTVVDRITGLRMLDQAGRPVGPSVGPFSEGHRLLLTCRANFAGELKGLEWLVKGEPMPSSWATPRAGTAETHIDLTLQSSHDHSDLVCRLTTLEKSMLSQAAHDPTFYPEYHELSPTPSQTSHATSSLSPKEELETNGTSNDKSTPTRKSRIANDQKTINGVESSSRDEEYSTSETEKSQGPYSRKDYAGTGAEGDDTSSFFRPATGHGSQEAAPEQSRKRQWESTITDVSILIQMYSMPVSRLTVLDAGSRGHTLWGGGGSAVEVREGGEITFKCAVKSRPPPYNITFMINGKVSPHTRGARDTLRLQPVDRRDSGLYTCLASNTEGDGHSNAILLKVIHSPYCQGSSNKKMVVARNTSVTLKCTVDAQPEVTTYNWVNADPKASKSSSRPPWELEGTTLGTGSTLTLVPTQESTQVVCYAKNSEGYSQVPCVYTLTVVDPPPPPKDCYVNVESPTRLEVSCNQGLSNPLATAEQNSSTSYQTLHSRPTSSDTSESNPVVLDVDSSHQNDVGGRNSSAGIMSHLQTTIETHHAQSAKGVVDTNELLMPPPSPGQLGFVRSSEVRPVTRLEVWNADGLLLVNMSSKTPEFSVRGLPPSSELTLRLYSFAKEIVSPPVVLYARTRAWPSPRPREEPTDAEVAQEAPVQPPQPPMLLWLAAAGAGALLLALVLAGAALVLLLVRRSRKRRKSSRRRQEESSDGGEGENGGQSEAGEGEGLHLESASRETVSMEESEFWIRPSGLQQPSLVYGTHKGGPSSLLEATRSTLEPSLLSPLPMLSSMATISLPPLSLTTMHTISVPTVNYSFPTSMAMTLPALPTVSTLSALPSITSIPALPNLFSAPSTSEERGGLLPNS